MRIALLLSIFLTACVFDVSDFYQASDVDTKPTDGYNRSLLFSNYSTSGSMGVSKDGLSSKYVGLRNGVWLPKSTAFRDEYPQFEVNLISVDNISEDNSFSWQERLIFADAVDLIVYVVNQPEFLTAMETQNTFPDFYQNDGNTIISAEYVVNSIRSSKLDFHLTRDSLESGVMAQATISGYNNVIWFRNDRDYISESVVAIADVLFHEMTHNLGWLHESHVPCGVQVAFRDAVNNISLDNISKFVDVTPYYEDDFLYKVRATSASSVSEISHQLIQKDYAHDLNR